MGTYGQELLGDAFGQMLSAITLLCGSLCATPPTSIVGVMLWMGYLGQAVLAHLREANLPIAFVSLAVCLALMAWGALALRDKSLRHIIAT
jgi:hypothetical protein